MKSILFSILSGLLLILCFPKYDIECLAWFALVPLLIAIKGKGLKSALGLCFITGIIFYTCVFYWFKQINGIGWYEFSLLAIYMSFFYFGLFGAGYNFISKKTKFPSIIIAPVLWIVLEYVRSHAAFAGIFQQPCMLMGHSQYLNISVIQISSLTGVYGVSFLLVMVNVAISEVIHNRSEALKQVVVAAIVLGITFSYGFVILTKGGGEDNVSITVIQPNIPSEEKWKKRFKKKNFEKHVRLTKAALNSNNTSLIAWPEAAVSLLAYDNYLSQNIVSLAREINTPLLIGSSQRPKTRWEELDRKSMFTNAFMISTEGKIVEQYSKIRLIPFSEYIPYKNIIPWPAKYVNTASSYIPGTEYTLFNLEGLEFGVTICWENLFSDLFSKFVKRGANFMINISNENRLGGGGASYQLAAINVFRAVENRVAIARAVNTGISCFIDPYGRFTGKVQDCNGRSINVEGFLTKEVPISHKRTFYTIYGDVFIYLNIAMAVFMIGLSFFRRSDLPLRHQDTTINE